MRFKSFLLLALLPVVTACSNCERVIRYELFPIGNTKLNAPVYIREDKMPVSWKLLTDNLQTFVVTSKISKALDDRQYESCMRLKEAATEQEKKTLKDEMRQYNKNIDELADIMQSPLKILPGRLQEWNKKLEYLTKETGMEDEIAPAPEKTPTPEKAPAPDMKAPEKAPESGADMEKGPGTTGTETTTAPDTTKSTGGGGDTTGTSTAPEKGQVTP